MKVENIYGDITGFPPVIVLAMLREQCLQKGYTRIREFQINRCLGFSFVKTTMPMFWRYVIHEKCFYYFFEHKFNRMLQ